MSAPEPPGNPKRKPTRTRVVMDFEPLAARLQIQSWIDHLRRDVKSGGVGLIISLTVHGVLMVILAFIIFQTRSTGDGDPLLVSWLTPSEKAESAARRRQPVAIPIDVGSIPSITPAQKPTPQASDTDESPKVGVKPVAVGQSLDGRNPRVRDANLERLGGTPDAERAIKQGLQWLVRQQKSDGHWELHQGYPDAGFAPIKTNTGATALALLAFLGHGNTHQSGEHKEVVAKGMKWLRAIQDPATGDLHDMRQEEGREPAFYAHSMGTIALCEAITLTGDNELKPAAEQAVRYLLASQHPEFGGWKWRPISKLMVGDLSVTGWALMALHTARMAGIEIQQEEFERSSQFLDSVQARGSSRYKFEPTWPDRDASPGLTAQGLLCRQWLGWPKTLPQMQAGVKYVISDQNWPAWSQGRRNVYAWYYTAQMLHNIGGEDWKRWNSAVRQAIVKNQITGGSTKPGQDVRGSWHPTEPRGADREFGEKGGRLYVTVMCILILETPYRYQPIYPPESITSE